MTTTTNDMETSYDFIILINVFVLQTNKRTNEQKTKKKMFLFLTEGNQWKKVVKSKKIVLFVW